MALVAELKSRWTNFGLDLAVALRCNMALVAELKSRWANFGLDLAVALRCKVICKVWQMLVFWWWEIRAFDRY
jgi:hypothetical protein